MNGVHYLEDRPPPLFLIGKGEHEGGARDLGHLVARVGGRPGLKHRFRPDLDARLFELGVPGHDAFELADGLLGPPIARSWFHLQEPHRLSCVGERHHLASDEVVKGESDDEYRHDPGEVQKSVAQGPADRPPVPSLEPVQPPLKRIERVVEPLQNAVLSILRAQVLEAATDEPLRYYYVIRPSVEKTAPLPSHPLAWTTIAYIFWDDLDPGVLTNSQQQALLDWLHWGGQLVISGPSSLDKLKGSLAPESSGDYEDEHRITRFDGSTGWILLRVMGRRPTWRARRVSW